MTDKVQLIRAEVKRLMQKDYTCDNSEQNTGYFSACYEILDFIDHLLEETVSEELDEEDSFDELLQNLYIKYNKGVSIEKLLDIASNFVKWQKQQLMKKAIEGIVATNIDGWINVMTGFIRPEEAGANFGDNVKVIIIKNE